MRLEGWPQVQLLAMLRDARRRPAGDGGLLSMRAEWKDLPRGPLSYEEHCLARRRRATAMRLERWPRAVHAPSPFETPASQGLGRLLRVRLTRIAAAP